MNGERKDLNQLKRIITANRDSREREQKMRAWLYARQKETAEAKAVVMTSFYCDSCDADFDSRAIKQVRKPTGAVWHAYYEARCPRGHLAVRWITDRLADPYFYKSFIVKREQARHADDFLTPSHPRFKLVYPRAYADLIARGEQQL